MENKILGSKGLARLIENISNTFSKIGHTHTKSQISDFPAIPTDDEINELISSACEDVVLHTEQTLTEEQKKQARDNIGVGETIADTLFALDLANPIVEDDGEYLATADGIILTFNEDEDPSVKRINGIAPDEKGNIEILIPEMPDIDYPVTSVNGMTGDVNIVIPEVVYPVTSVNGQTGDVSIEIPEVVYPVTSVNDQTGDVVIDIPDSIPTPTTASVGQTIVVKSVDENGKPTEWEAVDPWVMPSSTEGSNKKFKLTVDDNGSITITEITEGVN